MSSSLFAVIGYPLGHTLSPVMHNAVFKHLGLEHRYSAVEIGPGNLKAELNLLEHQGYQGLSVTIPHKVAVIAHLTELSREAELIGAVNTISFDEGKRIGFNTDGIGAIHALREASVEVKGKRVLLLGSGGAARAIGFQCLLEGAKLSIANRESEISLAKNLATEMKQKLKKGVMVLPLTNDAVQDQLKSTDVLIHATPVGMAPRSDVSIIDASIIPSSVAVMDIVYNPWQTKLLAGAKSRGCTTIDGIGMFINQGAAQLKIWLDINAPIDIMRDVVETELKKII